MHSRGYVVFSDDWGVHPSSAQHLFRVISRDAPVLWVNTIGMRDPDLSWRDLAKAIAKVRRMFSTRSRGEHRPQAAAASKNLRVCQPFMLPFSRFRMIRAFNRASVIRTVEAQLADMGLIDPVILSTVPNACDYASAFPERRLVYYCVDDFSLWPGHDASFILGMESELIARADLLIGTSSAICGRLSQSGKPANLLQHGVDIEHFSRSGVAEQPCLSGIPGPRVGYFGLLDQRLDGELIEALSSRHPGLQFILAGPMTIPLPRLQGLPNVHFTGSIPYAELPGLVQGLSALLLPYKTDALGLSLSPLKLREYLATGLPVISSSLTDTREYGELVRFADNVEAWSSALSESLGVSRESRMPDALRALEGQSWQEKAAQLRAWCEV